MGVQRLLGLRLVAGESPEWEPRTGPLGERFLVLTVQARL